MHIDLIFWLHTSLKLLITIIILSELLSCKFIEKNCTSSLYDFSHQFFFGSFKISWPFFLTHLFGEILGHSSQSRDYFLFTHCMQKSICFWLKTQLYSLYNISCCDAWALGLAYFFLPDQFCLQTDHFYCIALVLRVCIFWCVLTLGTPVYRCLFWN